ncbi:helix-turn-helix transcriptional regulator [Bacteroides sp. 51]|uniref:helix-turn-helix transcriptional regulator n=1 Tax=Bacteroides sp. 51 TaxID=2302938 RepID=UPI0013D00628|nr:helix-turn-helix transcriptional regulator [Bacteroides sp. 51]
MNNPVILNLRLRRLMEETRIYTERRISRRQVACMLYTNEMYLHNTIRRYYGCAFTDYIARLRMQYAVQMLEDPDCSDLSVEAIALDAGFGSRYTFHRLFKEQFGVTPDGYRKRRGSA